MSTTTGEQRTAAIRRHLEGLESRAHALPAGSKTRVQRHLAALKEQTGADERLRGLEHRVAIAGHSLAADLSDDRTSFEHAVQAELHGWDAYLGWLEAKAGTRDDETVAILKEGRDALEIRLDDAGTAAADRWDEQRQRVDVARERLEQRADELAVTLHQAEGGS
jgi:hypothetical protein